MREKKEKNRMGLIFLMVMLVVGINGGLFLFEVRASEGKKVPTVGPVKLNPHPDSLKRKTILLRWNGKYNGDKFLNWVGELLIQQVKNVKVIKMWEVDTSTAVISKNKINMLGVL